MVYIPDLILAYRFEGPSAMVLLKVRTLSVERGLHHHPAVVVAVVGDQERIVGSYRLWNINFTFI